MKDSTSKLINSVAFISFGALALGCAVPADTENASTSLFRSALVAEGDIELQSNLGAGSTARQALNGDPSEVAKITANTVKDTNKFIVAHFEMMDDIVKQPPTRADEDTHVWEATYKGIFVRMKMDKSEAPRGTRFDYTFGARKASESDEALKPLISGHVVRVETRPEELGKQGWGIVRFHFTNLNALWPDEHDAKGIARIAFRRVGKVRQVRVRMINMDLPKEPDFPKHSSYGYTLLPNDAGAMRWFAKGDFMNDGAPLENFSVHSAWRANKSGMGFAAIHGGSLAIDGKPVDYLNLTECWDATLNNTFVRQAIPDFSRDFGELSSCFAQPDKSLEAPEAEVLPDEDPEIPEAHEAEEQTEEPTE